MKTEEFDKLDQRFSEYSWHQAKIDRQVTDFMDELVDILIANNRFEFEVEEDLYWAHAWDDQDCYLIDVRSIKIDTDKTIYIKDGIDVLYELNNTTLTDLEVCEMLLGEIARIE